MWAVFYACARRRAGSHRDLETIDYRRFSTSSDGQAAKTAKSSKIESTPRGLLGQVGIFVLPPFKAVALLIHSQVAVYGHTIIPTGYQAIGFEQLILSTSFGMQDEHKTVLLVISTSTT